MGMQALDLGDRFVVGVRHLKINAEHVLCTLHGTINQPWQPSSRDTTVQTLLTDNNGDQTRIVFVKGPKVAATPAELNARFPPGSRVLIKEPFYKVLADGMPGVRVDDEAGVTLTTAPLSEIARNDPVARVQQAQKDGNELFKADDFRAAIDQYSAALEVFGLVNGAPAEVVPKEEFEIHKLYCNRAQCYLKTKDHAAALADAEEAIAHNPRFIKGYARRVAALGALGRHADATAALLAVLETPCAAEAKHLNADAMQYLGFPSVLRQSVELVKDPRVRTWEEYFVQLTLHVYKCVMSSYFTACQRENMTLTEEGGSFDMTAEEAALDLENREGWKKSEEKTARSVKGRTIETARELHAFLRGLELPGYKPSSITKVQENAEELNKLVLAYEKEQRK